MKTKGQDRRSALMFYYIVAIVIHICLYLNDEITGVDVFMGFFGFGIIWALTSMLEFDTDEELVKE
jgi:hypothetical protein